MFEKLFRKGKQPADAETKSADPHDILLAELNRSAAAEIAGVVGPRGSAGVGSGNEKVPWIFQFSFSVWRHPGNEIREQEIQICKPVGDDELRSLMGQLHSYEVIRVQARVAEQNSYGTPQGLLIKFIGEDSDPELHRRAGELQAPVTFEDERLGLFTLNRRVNWYEASVSWESSTISLHLELYEGNDPRASLATAHALWDLQSVWTRRVTDLAVAELLELKNDNWLDKDEKELSEEEFRSKMTLKSITTAPNGAFEIWYDDGDLFLGHSIRVSGDLADGPTDAGIAG